MINEQQKEKVQRGAALCAECFLALHERLSGYLGISILSTATWS
jgi:hypothetical protein